MIDVRRIDPSADAALARRMLELQLAAYYLEAALIGDYRIPTLHEDIDDLRLADLCWFGAFDGSDLAGTVAWAESSDLVDIDRLAVSPVHHRRGIGRALLRAVLEVAGERRVLVATGQGNAPARKLYELVGFNLVDHHEVLPGLWISRYLRPEAEKS